MTLEKRLRRYKGWATIGAVALLAAAAVSACRITAAPPTPVPYLPTLTSGAMYLVGPGCMSLLEEYDGPVHYRPKIPCHLQFGMLKIEGITSYGLPDDWETKRLHLKAATETAEDVDGVAEFLREEGFTEIRTHTGGDPRIYPPGVVSWNQPYSRLLALDAIADLDGVTRIDRIREERPAG